MTESNDMPEGMIQPGGRRPADPPPGLGQVAPYEGRCRCGTYPADAAHMCESEQGFEEVRIMRLRPGDAIVIQYQEDLSDSELAYIAERVKLVFPNHKAIVLGCGTQLSVVREEATTDD